ncbi:hypothetical protein [Desulfatirhabdium butyrativorans]|uniref:hypothetical protein n=1 Tax=Desulfatirhabdium butyrativorans TaxID=340467 RepID=UPI00040E9878|nr:hypothetical protein [Desulfatirhabdium butyrativorans]
MDIDELVESLGKQLTAKGKAIENLDRQIDELNDQKTCLETVVAPILSSNESAANWVGWHINKRSGEFGTYGISAQIDKLQQLKDVLSQDCGFLEQTIALYNRAAKGIEIEDVGLPPGVAEEVEGSVFNVDMDHPESRYQLQKAADYHMVNRIIVDAEGCPAEEGSYVLPDSSEIGDLVCLSGMPHICLMPGDGDSALYYCIGLQEPSEASEDYGLCHQKPCLPAEPNGA